MCRHIGHQYLGVWKSQLEPGCCYRMQQKKQERKQREKVERQVQAAVRQAAAREHAAARSPEEQQVGCWAGLLCYVFPMLRTKRIRWQLEAVACISCHGMAGVWPRAWQATGHAAAVLVQRAREERQARIAADRQEKQARREKQEAAKGGAGQRIIVDCDFADKMHEREVGVPAAVLHLWGVAGDACVVDSCLEQSVACPTSNLQGHAGLPDVLHSPHQTDAHLFADQEPVPAAALLLFRQPAC